MFKQLERFADHPEVNLEVARIYQNFAQQSLLEKIQWPEGLNPQQKLSLAEPAHIAAAFRSSDDERTAEIQKLASEFPQQIESLKRSSVRMAAAASMCAYDWRGHWGALRSDVANFDTASRALYFARIAHTARHSDSLIAKAGAAAFIAEEREVACDCCASFCNATPSKRCASPAASWIKCLKAVRLNRSSSCSKRFCLTAALPRAEVAEYFFRLAVAQGDWSESWKNARLAACVRGGRAADAGTVRDPLAWLLAAWLAELNTDQSKQAEALENAVNADPMNHELRFRLATVSSRLGQSRRGNPASERASRLSPETRLYKTL